MSVLRSIAHRDDFALDAASTLRDAMALMLKNRYGCVVLLEHKRPVGVITEGRILAALDEGATHGCKAVEFASRPVISALQDRPVEAAFDLIVTNGVRRLVLVNAQGEFSGVVLQEDLFDYLEEDVYKVDLRVVDLLASNPQLATLPPTASTADALHLMRQRRIGSVVVAKTDIALGILTEQDLLDEGFRRGRLEERLENRMSSPVVTIDLQASVTEALAVMRQRHIRHVVVTKERRPYALLTDRDIFTHVKGNVARMLQIKLRHAREIMDMLPEVIIEIFDMPEQQTIHWMNRRALRTFGTDLLEDHPSMLFGEAWQRIHEEFEATGILEGISCMIGGRRYEFSGSRSVNINSRYLKLIGRDVSEHEAAKEELRREVREEARLRQEQEYLLLQQSRLASMGEMISYIAHQWRQPLAQLGGIFMNLESAQAFGELDETYLQERLAQGNAQIKYMSQTIDDFRRFFSLHRTTMPFDLRAPVEQAYNIVRGALTYHHIEVQMRLPQTEILCEGNEGEFAQVMLNLFNNARDALVEQTRDVRQIRIELQDAGAWCVLRFSDNGGGIDAAVLPDLFKPYVSTKREGTGIGLYMTHLIVTQKMHGVIHARNDKNWACFEVRLPKAAVSR